MSIASYYSWKHNIIAGTTVCDQVSVMDQDGTQYTQIISYDATKLKMW